MFCGLFCCFSHLRKTETQHICCFLRIFPTVLFYRLFTERRVESHAAKAHRASIHSDHGCCCCCRVAILRGWGTSSHCLASNQTPGNGHCELWFLLHKDATDVEVPWCISTFISTWLLNQPMWCPQVGCSWALRPWLPPKAHSTADVSQSAMSEHSQASCTRMASTIQMFCSSRSTYPSYQGSISHVWTVFILPHPNNSSPEFCSVQ